MRRNSFSILAAHSVLLFAAAIFALPLLWMVLTSFRRGVDIQGDPSLLPFPGTLENYRKVFRRDFFWTSLGNSLMVMSLSGAQIKALLESQQKPTATEPTFLQPSEGLTYTWQADAPAGERVQNLRLQGEALVPGQAYRVTVNNFLAEGGDGFVLLKEGTARLGGGQDVDALVAYLGAAPPREPSAQARIGWAP